MPSGDGVVTGQGIHNTGDGLHHRTLGLTRAIAIYSIEARAFVHTAGTRIACVNDVLQQVLIPAGQEVSMETVASGIAIGEYKGLLALARSPAVLESWCVPIDLEKQMREMEPTFWTVPPSVTGAEGICHVVLEVG